MKPDNKKATFGQESGLIKAQFNIFGMITEWFNYSRKSFAIHKIRWGITYIKQSRYSIGISLLLRGVLDLIRGEKT